MEFEQTDPFSFLDWEKMPRNLSTLLDVPKLLETFFRFLIAKYQVKKGVYVSLDQGDLRIEAIAALRSDNIVEFDHFSDAQAHAIDDYVSTSMINGVISSQSTFVMGSPESPSPFENEEILNGNQILLICHPIIINHECIGVLYLECEGNERQFPDSRMTQLKTISFEIGSMLKSLARFNSLEQKEREFTKLLDHTRKEANQAVEGKNRLIKSIIQEIRAPLNTILGYCELLEKGAESTRSLTETRHYIQNIQLTANNLNEITTNLTEVVNLGSEADRHLKEEIRIKLFIQGVFHLLKEKADKKGTKLSFRFANNIPYSISCERSRLNLVIMNLVRFMIKIAAAGGSIVIDVYRNEDNLEFSIGNFLKELVITNKNSPIERTSDCVELDPSCSQWSDFSEIVAVESAVTDLGGVLRTEYYGQTEFAFVLSIPNRDISDVDRMMDLSQINRKPDLMDSTPYNLSKNVDNHLIEGFRELSKIPIYRGGTLRAMIRDMIHKNNTIGARFASTLVQIEEAVFEGNEVRFKTLVNAVLNHSNKPLAS